jgi:phosphopantetheine--protein transferase-like protein
MRKVFTAREAAYASARPRTALLHLAGRFAAKEAVIKAISQINPSLVPSMNQIEICNDRHGRPSVMLHRRGVSRLEVHVSLSHVDTVAVASAFVIRKS